MPSKKSSKPASKKKQARTSSIATYLQRSVATRDKLPRFLIVCEGEKTEPNYFEALAAELRVSVRVRIEGLGDNTDSLVDRAIELSKEDDYAQAWCVFDRDSFPPERFNRAIEIAQSNDLLVAYSNEAFELWYVLHFEYLQSGLPRGDYQTKLSKHLGKRYEKNNPAMYRNLQSRQQDAIRHAKRLLALYDPHWPERDNPSTTVHLLVEALRSFGRD